MNQTPMLLIGIGGAGGRIVADTVTLHGIDSALAVAIDTDFAESSRLTLPRRLCIGQDRFNGNGTGGQDTLARTAAREDATRIAALFDGVRFAVVVAGTGGGAGAGITPEVLRIAYERNVPTLVFAVSPFTFEGEERRRLDARTRPLLETRGGAVVYLENDRLAAAAGPDATVEQAREVASRLAAEGIALLWQLVAKPGYISLDLATLVSLLRNGRGRARFGFARAEGPGRVEAAIEGFFSPASGVAEAFATAPAIGVGILGGPDLRLQEVGDAMKALRAQAHSDAALPMGTVVDPALNGSFALAVLVFESWSEAGASAPPPPPVRLPRAGVAGPISLPPERPSADDDDTDDDNTDDAPADAPPPERVAPAPVADAAPRRTRRAGPTRTTAPVTSRKDRFRDTLPYLFQGESLDEPTYLRRGLRLHDD